MSRLIGSMTRWRRQRAKPDAGSVAPRARGYRQAGAIYVHWPSAVF